MTLPPAVRPRSVDDSAALDEIVGDAPLVAIGENNHGVREFGELRERLVLHLVRERGFGVVAMESGFAEGALVDAWVQGADGAWDDVARDGFTFRAGDHAEMRSLVHALRSFAAGGGSVRVAGLDIPGSGGSPEPALRRLRDLVPPEVVDRALEATAAYASANNGLAPGRWSGLSVAAQDAATAASARLFLAASGDDLARHLALGALRLDEQLREFAVLFAPDPPARVVSSRDAYMAETARFLRASGEKVVLLLHNGHAQRVPFAFMPGVSAPSAGTLLAEAYGEDYVVVGLTAVGGSTTGLALDETARHGIVLSSEPLGEPASGSVEEAVVDAGLGAEPVVLDLRPARGAPGPTSIRHATTHIPVDVAAGYDAVVCLPTQTR
ncbi:erythromycin esterase [Actinomycetospora succinea]|uniref:Erythromycin esterase n=1 Tax=Actinomycetospora succinea TaxID=663603 RepID=A0A4R6VD13_9PSEU|nr:erythromycin esterase family protein [Actinomycetospora succinea]TDQ58298.1 erythromycin esterase [Actinomycetospora succinea]